MRETSQENVALLLKSLIFPAGSQVEPTRALKHGRLHDHPSMKWTARNNYVQPSTFPPSLFLRPWTRPTHVFPVQFLCFLRLTSFLLQHIFQWMSVWKKYNLVRIPRVSHTAQTCWHVCAVCRHLPPKAMSLPAPMFFGINIQGSTGSLPTWKVLKIKRWLHF